jgi:tetratricopeptide (TPR) repeat protein
MLAGRYEILQMLGQGGMGTVYKARDHELDRLVAIKVIRGELASHRTTLARFKQEVILARQITHKNVIRIYDFGTHESAKFITMEFVEGSDLSAILRERRFTPEEAARTVRQVCAALDAAHAENVVHRDLKPQNIMIDRSGRVRVMDFGLARSVEMSGLTHTGTMLGTPAYMSPEQAKGETVDARSDLFSMGIILYELLTGEVPYRGDTVWASLMARIQGPPAAPVTLDATFPQALNDIAMKCLATNPAARYQSAAEALADLNYWLGDTPGVSMVLSQVPAAPPVAPPARRRAKWLTAAVALAAVIVLAILASRTIWQRQGKVPNTVTVLVADFTNHTGDPIFDDTLEPMVQVALEGASFINTFSRGDARKLARQLPKPNEKLDEQSARLVALSQALGAVVTGSLSRRGDGYKFSMEALDGATGNSIAAADTAAPTKDGLLLAIPTLVAPIRKALGDTTSESAQLQATRGAFTAASLEAVHWYGTAMQQQFAGKFDDAVKSFSKAVELDPNFARAWAGMAGQAANLNRLQDAQAYFKQAMAHVDRMTERERFRARGIYYRRMGDLRKCVEEYTELVKQFPADNIGHLNLANCYMNLHNMSRALEEARHAVQISPRAALQHRALALIASYASDPQTAEREARAALQINPGYEHAYLPLAYAQILQGQLTQAAGTYRQLEKVSKLGASFCSAGLADIAVYEGRFAEAVKLLEAGITFDQRSENLYAPEKLATLAYVHLLQGQKRQALEAAERAVSSSKKTNIRFLMARIYAAAGETEKARALAAQLAADSHLEPQADAKLIEGAIALESGKPIEAIKIITEANQSLDTWPGRYDLGRAYLESGQFPEADSEFDSCIRRRGEALELDDGPTYAYFPPVYYSQGRVREGLKSPGAAKSFRTYLEIRGKAAEDPLLPDIRRRAGQ